MTRTLSGMHGFVTEVVTESTTPEIALWGLGIASALFVVGLAAGRFRFESALSLRASAFVLAIVVLSVQVRQNGWLTGRDQSVTSWFVAHRSAGFDVVAHVVTDLGSPVATALFAFLVGALVSWRRHSVEPAVAIIGTVGLAAIASTTLKMLIGRSRPPVNLQLILETDRAFPSGHVTGTATLLGMIVVVVAVPRGRRAVAALGGLAALAIVAIALTRLYLGVHWLTDVVAGGLLAALFVTVGGTAAHHVAPWIDRTIQAHLHRGTAADQPSGGGADRRERVVS